MINNGTTAESKMRKITTRTEAKKLDLTNEEKCYSYAYNDMRSIAGSRESIITHAARAGYGTRFGGLPMDRVTEICGIALDDRTKEVETILAARAAYVKKMENHDPECYGSEIHISA